MIKTLLFIVGSLGAIVIVKFCLTDIPETWDYGQETGEIVYELSLATFFAAALYLFQLIRYIIALRKFHNKTFIGYYKQVPDTPVQKIKLTVKDNVIQMVGETIGNKVDPVFTGELIMNPINLKIGEGFQYHTKSEGYCFIKAIIRDDNTFLIDSPYIKMIKDNTTGTVIPQAFIWHREQ